MQPHNPFKDPSRVRFEAIIFEPVPLKEDYYSANVPTLYGNTFNRKMFRKMRKQRQARSRPTLLEKRPVEWDNVLYKH